MNNSGLTLETCIKECRIDELEKVRSKEIEKDYSRELSAIKTQHRKFDSTYNSNNNFKKKSFGKDTFDDFKKDLVNCEQCLTVHAHNRYPAYRKICVYCKSVGHFAVACKKKRGQRPLIKQTNALDQQNQSYIVEEEESRESFYIDSLDVFTLNESRNTKWFETIKVNDNFIDFKIDTGSETDVLPTRFLSAMGDFTIEKTSVVLEAYDGGLIYPKGTVTLQGNLKNKTLSIKFLVVDTKSCPVIGFSTCKAFGLIKNIDLIECIAKKEVVKRHIDVFKGLVSFPEPLELKLKNNVSPVMKP